MEVAVPKVSRTRLIAMAGLFAALYLGYGFVSSLVGGPILRGTDVHLVRALLFAVLASRLGSPGGPTLMGLVSGILLTGIPGPSAIFLLPATIGAAGVYELTLMRGDYRVNSSRASRIVLGSLLSGLVESAIVNLGLLAVGFPFVEAVTTLRSLTGSVSDVLLWTFLFGRNLVMSLVGGLLAISLTRSRRVP